MHVSILLTKETDSNVVMTKIYTQPRPIIISPKQGLRVKKFDASCRSVHLVVGPFVGQSDIGLRTIRHQILHISKQFAELYLNCTCLTSLYLQLSPPFLFYIYFLFTFILYYYHILCCLGRDG